MRASSILSPSRRSARRLRLRAAAAFIVVVWGGGAFAQPAGTDTSGPAQPAAATMPPPKGASSGPQAQDPPKPNAQKPAAAKSAGESVDAALCRLIEDAAGTAGIPISFFTRLIWRESSFRTDVVSHAGAQGIAQFMPATARERGLQDPFDPAAAIPASAHLLADLNRRFGNLGLAAAAYNAGPGRVTGFLAGGALPSETRNYVAFITGASAEAWANLKRRSEAPPADVPDGTTSPEAPPAVPEATCLQTVASLRKGAPPPSGAVNELFAPWGVQISGNYSRDIALASFRRAAGRHPAVFLDLRPVIIATRVGGRGARVFYRVRLPAETRADAMKLCARLRKAGGACLVLPN